MVLSGEMAIISFHIPFTSINPITEGEGALSIGFCYLNIISLIRGERLKLLARPLWTCQRIIVHAKQDSSNILSIIIYNTTREENDEQIN